MSIQKRHPKWTRQAYSSRVLHNIMLGLPGATNPIIRSVSNPAFFVFLPTLLQWLAIAAVHTYCTIAAD